LSRCPHPLRSQFRAIRCAYSCVRCVQTHSSLLRREWKKVRGARGQTCVCARARACARARVSKDGYQFQLRCAVDAEYFFFRDVRDIPPPYPPTRVQNSRGPPICAQASVTPRMLEQYAKRRLASRTQGHVRARVSTSLLPRTRLCQYLHSLNRADPLVEHDFFPWCQGKGAGLRSQRTL